MNMQIKELETLLQFKEQDDNHFACSQQFLQSNYTKETLQSLYVKGVGQIPVPVSCKDIERLKKVAKQTSSIHGLGFDINPTMRHGWKIDAKEIMKLPNKFFIETTIPDLASVSLKHLTGLDSSGNPSFQIDIEEMVLYESGGYFTRGRETTQTDGLFGRMVMQIPVQNGFKGGQLNIKRNGLVKKFNMNRSDESHHNAFNVTIFFSDCDLELEPVTRGWMLALMLNLSWKSVFPLKTLPVHLPKFLQILPKIENALKPWILEQNKIYQQESVKKGDSVPVKVNGVIMAHKKQQQFKNLLFFPLANEFRRYVLSFSMLTEQDELLAHVLQSINTIDVHLATVNFGTKNRSKKMHEKECRISCSEVFDVRIHNWISADNNHTRFDSRDIKLTSCLFARQLVGDAKTFLDRARQYGKRKKSAVLIIQARQESIATRCRNHLDSVLGDLESQSSNSSNGSKSTKQRLVASLDQVIAFCRENPYNVWKDPLIGAERTRRLFRTCLNLNAKQSGIAILDLLGTDFILDDQGKVLSRNILTVEDIESKLPETTSQADTSFNEEYDELEDDSGSDEELVCCAVCLLTMGNQFMISCDECHRWHHGKCVDVTRAMGQELYDKDLEWICSKCIRKSSENQQSKNVDATSSLLYQGIQDEEVAKVVVEFLRKFGGWTDCTNSILRLVSSTRLPQQLTGIVHLIEQLLVGCLLEEAVCTANRLASVLAQLSEIQTCVTQNQIKAYINLVIILEVNARTANPERILLASKFFIKLNTLQQCQVIIDLHNRPVVQHFPSCRQFYEDLCGILVDNDLHTCSKDIQKIVVQLVKCYQLLKDPNQLQKLITNLALGPACETFFEPILSSQVMWEQDAILSIITMSRAGRKILINAVNARISRIKDQEQSQDHFLDDLLSCIFFTFCVVNNLKRLAYSNELDSLMDVYCKLSEEQICHVICKLIELFEHRLTPNRLASHPLVDLIQLLLKQHDISEKAAALIVQAAQLFLKQDEFFYQTLIRLVIDAKIATLYKKILIEVDFYNYPNPTWTFDLLMKAWMNFISQNYQQKNGSFSDIVECFSVLIRTEKLLTELDSSTICFIFDDMSTQELGQLIVNIYNLHSTSQPPLKSLLVSFNTYEYLCRTFAGRDLGPLIDPASELLLLVMKAVLWLDNESSLMPLCSKICSFCLDNPAVCKILNCQEIQQLVLTSSKSSCIWNAYSLLLDQRMNYLKTIIQPKFSWMQPDAVMVHDPLVQDFLRSELKWMIYRKNFVDNQTVQVFIDQMKTKNCFVNIVLSEKDTYQITKNCLHKQPTNEAETELFKLQNLRQSIENSTKSDLCFATYSPVQEVEKSKISADATGNETPTCLIKIGLKLDILNLIDLVDSMSSEPKDYFVDDLDENIINCVLMYKENLDLLSPLVEKLSAWRISRLLANLYRSELKINSSCFDLCCFIGQQFILRDLNNLLKSTSDIVIDTVVDVMICLLWLGDDRLLSPFTRKICSIFSSWQENVYVTKIVASSEARRLAVTCQANRSAFCLLLEQRINRLKFEKLTVIDVKQQLEEIKALLSSLEGLFESEEFQETSISKRARLI